jgi:gluconolactonase
VASHFNGRRLNSPNDVAIHPNGTIVFTDPHYGYLGDYPMDGSRELDINGVFTVNADGEVRLICSSLVMPNGLAFSPTGEVLYIADSGGSHFPQTPGTVHRFCWNDGENPVEVGPPINISPGYPDGITCDPVGNIWSSAGDGVHCYSSAGELLHTIYLEDTVTNLCFGGETESYLFVTTATSLYQITVKR